jgi:DNA-binding NarL/FixJ family response regulator
MISSGHDFPYSYHVDYVSQPDSITDVNKRKRSQQRQMQGHPPSRNPHADLPKLVKAGISGFIPKGTTRAGFLTTIRSVAGGTSVLPPSGTAKPSNGQDRDIPGGRSRDLSGSAPLTTRQHQILALVQKGLSRKEIARKLHITRSTVAGHVHNIFLKLL